MDAACRGGGAIACVFSGVEPTGRRAAGCGFGTRQGLSLGTTGTIGHFQMVGKTPVAER